MRCFRKIFALTYIILFALFLVSCADSSEEKDVRILLEESWFDDFSVEDDIVRIKCVLTIENKEDCAMTANIIGNFQEDVATGLLIEDTLHAVLQNDESDTSIQILPGKQEYQVVFNGTFGGTELKANRLLPDIRIVINN